MRQSELFTKTEKENPRDEKSINGILLQRAGFVYKEMAGVYSFLPLGLRVLNKIKHIIREEMNAIGGQEVELTVLQPKELWLKTGRWSKGIGEEIMYKCDGGQVGLGPTHEEMLTDIVKHYVKTQDDLPFYIYQIQTKFRKEVRAKSGLLRTREFPMKDLYSFHASENDFKEYYEKVKQAYLNIFTRCALKAIITQASGGDFTQEFSHEFQILSNAGEDTIIYCPGNDFAQNTEITKFKPGNNCPVCGSVLKQSKSIEGGNIFPLGTKYSKALAAFFTDKKGKKQPLVMGCYGIGVGRLMAAVVEIFHDEKGILWPEEIAPFKAHLLALPASRQTGVKNIQQTAEKIYQELLSKGIEVLFDDRKNKTAGEKFAEADLIGCPYRLVVSEATLLENKVEVKRRDENGVELIDINTLSNFLFKN